MRWAAVAVALVAGALLVGGYAAAGGADYQPTPVSDPCERRAVPDDAPLQDRLVGSALDGAACDLGIPREDLVLALAGSRDPEVLERQQGLPPGSVEQAIRRGLDRAVDDAEDAGAINSIEAFALRTVVSNVPVDSLLRLLEELGGLS